jgi:hypothetical protein
LALSHSYCSGQLLEALRSSRFNPIYFEPDAAKHFAERYPQAKFRVLSDAAEYRCPHTDLEMKVPITAVALTTSTNKIHSLRKDLEVASSGLTRMILKRDAAIEALVKEYIAHKVLTAVSLTIEQGEIAGRNRTIDRKRKKEQLIERVNKRMREWDERALSSAPAAAGDSEGTHARRADADEEDAIDASLENDSGAQADNDFIDSDID